MIKAVSFKDKKEKDLIEFVEDKDFSYYVKNLIREDMKKNNSKEKEVAKNNKRNTNFDI